MHALRTSSLIARGVLVWFALVLAVAIASPMVVQEQAQLVCSDAGIVKLVVVDAQGEVDRGIPHTLGCSLCLPASLPAPLCFPAPSPFQLRTISNEWHPFVAAHIAATVGAPLPPRGPPHHA